MAKSGGGDFIRPGTRGATIGAQDFEVVGGVWGEVLDEVGSRTLATDVVLTELNDTRF